MLVGVSPDIDTAEDDAGEGQAGEDEGQGHDPSTVVKAAAAVLQNHLGFASCEKIKSSWNDQ